MCLRCQYLFSVQTLDRFFECFYNAAITWSVCTFDKREFWKIPKHEGATKAQRRAGTMDPQVVRIVLDHCAVMLKHCTVFGGKKTPDDFSFRGMIGDRAAKNALRHDTIPPSVSPVKK